MKITRWDDGMIDTHLFLQLQDLTSILSKVADFNFEYTYGSFVDLEGNRITASSIWDTTELDIQKAGYKTDVYLRAIGTMHHSQLQAFHDYWNDVDDTEIPQFATQLITLLEDLRLEEIVKRSRPGTINDFTMRKEYLKHYFKTQLTTNVTRGYVLDELFCMIYLLLQSDGPDQQFPYANKQQQETLERIKPDLYESFEAKTTQDMVNIASRIVTKLKGQYEDTMNVYFAFPIFMWDETYKRNTLFDELTRTDDVANEDREEVDQENNDYTDETFSTWHGENENADRKQTFLQMDLNLGTKTNLKGGGARETEEGDQAFAAVQGTSGRSKQQDYSKLEAFEEQAEQRAGKSAHAPYGDDNIDAVAIYKEAEKPTDEDVLTYETVVTEIESYKRHLANTIEKILEHKKSLPRQNLHFGRLSKNLLPIVTDENPRLFYKKDQDSHEFDAIFTLMVDCSASMHQKMEETKRGIVLFHEVLKQLKIPHMIVGFWEDAITVTENEQPNYFHIVHSFTDSLYENNDGAKIMQLEPEEDNRDGFSIRVVTEKMMERREKHKFLLVFSDGEPAAANYDDNGIVDTHMAVLDARKQGIDVIGMFLSDGVIDEREDKLMENIYGRGRLMIPDVSELPELFTPILKMLLLKTI